MLLLALSRTDPGPVVGWASVLLGFGAGATVSPGLFLAAFGVPSETLGRAFALVELLRSESAYAVAPVVAVVAQGTGNLAGGVRIGLLAMAALGGLGLVLALVIPAVSGARLRAPDLDGWLNGDGKALPSPTTATHLRPSVEDDEAEPLLPRRLADRKRDRNTRLVHWRMAAQLTRETRVVHGHRRAFVRAGNGPPLLLLHGMGTAPDLGRGDRPAGRVAHGHRARPAGPRRVRQAARRLLDRRLRQRHARPARRCSASTGRPSSATRSAAASRCSSPTSSPSGASGWCWWAAAASARSCPPAARRDAAGRRVRADGVTGVSGPLRAGLRASTGSARLAGLQRVPDLAEVGEALLALKDVEARRAFLRTLRGVVDARGQAVTALDRLYLATPSRCWSSGAAATRSCRALHAETVRELVPGRAVEVFEGAGHWPHLDDPDRFCAVLLDFLATTEAAAHDARAGARC